MKRIWISLVAVMLAVILPVSALALTSASKVESVPSANGGYARDYVLSFGVEHKLGECKSTTTYRVYSAPSLNAVRGANGKASMLKDEAADSAGWNGAWLLVRYGKVNGGYRVGWIPKSELNMRSIEATRNVNFAYWPVTLEKDCILTDDPLLESEVLAYASAGEQLTYLAFYQYNGGKEYAYVQGDLNGRPVCGFIPFDAIAW